MLPAWKVSIPLLSVIHQRLSNIARFVWRDDGPQPDQRAIVIPAGDVLILGVSTRNGMDLAIETKVLPIYITEDVGMEEAVVERGVEDDLLILCPTLHLNSV